MREGKSPIPMGRTGLGILLALLIYCAIFWLPPFTGSHMLGISINVWGGMGLLVFAPVAGLIFALRAPKDEDKETEGAQS